jgi:hypothetical protein
MVCRKSGKNGDATHFSFAYASINSDTYDEKWVASPFLLVVKMSEDP